MGRIAGQVVERVTAGEVGEAVREVCGYADGQAKRVKQEVLQAVIEGAVDAALGPRGGERKTAMAPWECRECGPRRGDQLSRNGRYRRQLLVIEGTITLMIPQLLCRDCRKSVAFTHALLAPRRHHLPLTPRLRAKI